METTISDAGSSSVVLAKGSAMGSLFLASMIFGLIPLKLAQIFKWGEVDAEGNVKKDARTSLIVSILLSFGGGVLLATTFLHLLPEISANIVSLQHKGLIPESTSHLHLPELLMCAGFFTIYLVEELVHTYLHRHKKNLVTKKDKLKAISENNQKTNTIEALSDNFVRGANARNSNIIISLNQKRRTSLDDPINGKSTADLINSEDNNRLSQISIENGKNHQHSSNGHSHSHLPTPSEDEDMLVSSLRGLLIVLALSVHELFEGLAVGLESSAGNVWYMFAAVAAHKFVIAFCIGVELMVQRTKVWLAVIYVFTFAVVSPLGIGLGILLSSGPHAEKMEVPSVILQGLATGTLLYVIFFEVLSKDRSGLVQYVAVLVGFLIMLGLQFIGDHKHSHSHGISKSDHGLIDHDHDHELLDHDHSHHDHSH